MKLRAQPKALIKPDMAAHTPALRKQEFKVIFTTWEAEGLGFLGCEYGTDPCFLCMSVCVRAVEGGAPR